MRFHRESKDEAYDVVVVGAGIGGLTAASLMAQRGCKVLVVERHDRPGGYAHAFRRKRYLFDSAVHLIGGCAPGDDARPPGLVQRLLSALHVSDSCDFLRVDPFYSAVLPGFRLDAPLGVERFAEAHAERFPAEREGLRRLLQVCVDTRRETLQAADLAAADFAAIEKSLPTLMQHHRATLADVLDAHLEDDRLKAVLGAPWPYLGLPPSKVSFLYFASMLLSYLEDGAWYCQGSFQNLARALVRALRRSGGELLLQSAVQQIRVEGGRVRGVSLENGQRIQSPLVVSGVDASQTFEQLVGTERLPRRFLRSLHRMQPSVSAFLVYGATGADLGALGAAHEMFVYRGWDHDRDYRNLMRGEISRIGFSVPTLTDPSLAPAGEHVFQITVLLPYALRRSWRQEKSRYTELLLAEAERELPGLRDGVRFVEAATPRTLERYTRNREGAMYGWDALPSQIGPGRLGTSSPIEGLLLAGHWTQPGGGIYGVIASGVQAARAALGVRTEQALWRDLEREATPRTPDGSAPTQAGAWR